MKKLMAASSLLLALVVLLSVPASAAAILTGESFGKTSKNKWETDVYAPEEFDFSDNQLYLSVGSKGYTKNRPGDQKAKTYAQQGMKLAVEKPGSTTWTATVKLNVDETWLSTDSNRKRVEFRVDLVDGSGNAVTPSPALALIKSGSAAPVFKFVNPAMKTGWGMGTTFINGDKEKEDFYIEEGWHTLIIKSTKGVLTYYVDEKKLGNCTVNESDVYPSYMALGAYNYERPDVSTWDNCYLYNGSFGIAQRSSSLSEKREDSLSSRYASKRASWTKRYTQYSYSNHWFNESDFRREAGLSDSASIPSGTSTRLSKEIPDSYWDY